jgi:hypothetical protein
MNIRDRDLLIFARNLLVEVRTMSFNLLRLQEKVEAISKQEKPKNSADNQPLPPIISVLTTPTAIKVEPHTRERKDIWQRIFEVIETVGILAVVAYAVLTYYLWKEAIRSADAAQQSASFTYHQAITAGHSLIAARDQVVAAQQQVDAINRQVRQTERPWIYVAGPTTQDFSINGGVGVTLAIANIGKSPAKYLWAVFMIDRVENGQSLSPLFIKPPKPGMAVMEWLKQTLNRPIWRTYTGIYFPNQPPIPIPVQWSEPTGKGEAIRPRLLSRTDFDDVGTGKQFFIVHGIVAYGDTFGSKRFAHWTQYCTWIYPKDAVFTYRAGECSEYNNADANE